MAAMGLGLGLGLAKKSPPPITNDQIELIRQLTEKLDTVQSIINNTGEAAEVTLVKLTNDIEEAGINVPDFIENVEQLLSIFNHLK